MPDGRVILSGVEIKARGAGFRPAEYAAKGNAVGKAAHFGFFAPENTANSSRKASAGMLSPRKGDSRADCGQKPGPTSRLEKYEASGGFALD